MPIAEIQLPDGRIAEFDVPDGTTPQQVIDYVSQNQNLFAEQAQTTPEQQSDVLIPPSSPAIDAPQSPEGQAELAQAEVQKQRQGQGLGIQKELEQLPVVGGAIAGVNDIRQGMNQVLSGALASTGSETYQKQYEDINRQAREREQYMSPENEPSRLVGQTIGALALGGGGIIPSAVTGALATPYVPEEENQGSVSDLYTEKGLETIIGSALPLGFKKIEEVASKFIAPVISDASKALASKARDFGIDLRIDQIAPTRFRNTVQKVSQEIFGSNVDAFEELQRNQWNKAVAKTLSPKIDDLSPESLNKFTRLNSAKFNSVLNKQRINIIPEDIDLLREQQQFLKNNMSPLKFKNIDNKIEKIIKSFDGRGYLDSNEITSAPAKQIANLRSTLLDQMKSAKLEERQALTDLVDYVDDLIFKNISPEDSAILKSARKEYRNFKIVQKAAEKSPDGSINPTQLLNSVSSNKYIDASRIETGQDEIVDLARIGKEFMPKKGGSDTMQKSALLGTGAYVGSVGVGASVPIAGGVIAGNRAFQKGINQNQKIIDKIIKGDTTGTSSKALSGVATAIPKGVSAVTQEMNKQGEGAGNYEDFLQNLDAQPSVNEDEYQKFLNDLDTQFEQSTSTNNAGLLDKIAMAESGGNPNAKAKTSSASGLFQFTNGTWRSMVKKYGDETGIAFKDKLDPDAQRVMAEKLLEENRVNLKNALGKEPTGGELYIAHFAGPATAKKIIQNKNRDIVARLIVPKSYYEANKPIFKTKDGRQRTIKEVYNLLTSKVA